ncbi:MAG: zincin-like metallopeptidase domain-containing protein, partial [Planctomycetota bacterium]
FFATTGIEIVTTDEPRAYYAIDKDHIHMPPISTFFSASEYYGVLGHESCHSTGAKHRLDRLTTYADREAYAFEELVAEIGASILAVQLEYEPHFDQCAAYIEGWLEALRKDRDMIFKAAAEAQKAVDLLLRAANSQDAAA